MSPYSEGFRAFLAGHTIHQNPYTLFTREYDEWREGWEDHKEHQTAKDSALDSIGWFG